MNRQKNLSINLITSFISFIINIGINFLLTPYITKSIGVEAYGFVSLGTNFINYASLVTIALNSMAGRFITIEIHKDNWKKANEYFNSVLLANVIVTGVMLIPSVLCVAYIDRIVNVPSELLTDVRVLFTFLFANFLISIMVSSFGVATFATNRLYLKSLRETESSFIKALVLMLAFLLFKPAISYLGIASFIVLLYTTVFNVYYTKKYLPKIKLKRMYFDLRAVMELISSGIWNTVIRVGQILLDGVDLLLSNLFISAASMGILALAKTIPMVVLSLVGVIAGAFVPDFTILYAHNKNEDLIASIKQSMNILGIITNIPVAILVAFGEDFYRLWVPNQDPKLLQALSVITLATIVVSGSINSIYSVFTVTNKLKSNAMVLIMTGVINIIIVLVLLKNTNLGIYAIAGVSSILGIFRNLFFTAPFGARYLGLKWYTFFPEVIKSVIAFTIEAMIGLALNYVIEINSWFTLIAFSVLTACIGLIINLIVILNNSDRKYLFEQIKIGGK